MCRVSFKFDMGRRWSSGLLWEEAQKRVEEIHGPGSIALPLVTWSDGLQFARTHEMNMDVVCAGVAGLHEEVIKKDDFAIHMGWRANLFLPKRMKLKDKATAAKVKVFQQSMYLILKDMRRLEKEGMLLDVGLLGVPVWKRFYPVWLKHPCDIKEAHAVLGIRSGSKAKCPHLFAEVPRNMFASHSLADVTEDIVYPIRTESRHVQSILEARKHTRQEEVNGALREHSLNQV